MKKWYGVIVCLAVVGLCIGGIVQSQSKPEAVELEYVVYAPQNGKVIYVDDDNDPRMGQLVIVGYEDGIAIAYHHLDEILVKVGQAVEVGDDLGRRVQISYDLSNIRV